MAKHPRALAGKIAAVTGGGRGIGRAIARRLASEGVIVAVADVDAAAARSVAAELGPRAFGAGVDVTDRPAFTAFLDDVERRIGPLDILVNNAGIMPVAPLEDEDDASVSRQLEVNLHAVIHGTREAMRRMRPRETGHIVNVASLAGRHGFPWLATYCATKHAVVGLSEAVRAELRGSGVEISVVMPGLVDTELAKGVGDARWVRRVKPEEVAAEVVEALRMPRFDVFVPRSLGPMVRFLGVLPRGARERFVHLLRGDEALLRTDRSARRAYETRAAASAPHADELYEEARAA